MSVIEVERPEADAAPIWRLVSARAKAVVDLGGRGGVPVFCVHSVAGDITGYGDLAALLGRDQEFYGIQVRKAEMNAAFAGSVEAIARRHVEAVNAVHPDGPVVVAGFSAGAVVALEMARQLRGAGRAVPLLVALDGAPNNSGATLPSSDPRYLLALARNLPRWLASEELRDWTPRHVGSRLFNRFVFRGGTGEPALEAAPTTHLDAVLGVLDRPQWQASQRQFIRAMFNAIRDYRPSRYDGRVLVYETRAQPLFHLMQVGTVWRALAPLAEIVTVPGKHQSFFRGTRTIGPVASDLLARLRDLD